MKSTGIVRHMDSLGRVVIPIEIRRNLEMKEEDPIEIFTEDKTVVLKKYNPGCSRCGALGNLTKVFGMWLCPTDLEKFKEAVKVLEEKGELDK